MLQYVVGGTFLTFMSSNIVNSIVSGTLDTLYSSISFAKNGSNCNKIIEKVKKDLEYMDINIKLELVKTLIAKHKIHTNDIDDIDDKDIDRDINIDSNCNGDNDTNKDKNNDIIKIIINGISELTDNIKSVIAYIDSETANHNQKWFAGYRAINFESKIEELKKLIAILDGRIILLLNTK